MFDKLVALADKLDKSGNKEIADFIDKLIKSAAGEEEWVDEPTKPYGEEALPPMPSSVPPLDPSSLEVSESASGMETVSQLRTIFQSRANPENWDEATKVSVLKLLDRLRESM